MTAEILPFFDKQIRIVASIEPLSPIDLLKSIPNVFHAVGRERLAEIIIKEGK